MEYRFISGFNATEFTQQVNHLLADGWRLWGGVAVAITHDGLTLYAQALIKGE